MCERLDSLLILTKSLFFFFFFSFFGDDEEGDTCRCYTEMTDKRFLFAVGFLYVSFFSLSLSAFVCALDNEEAIINCQMTQREMYFSREHLPRIPAAAISLLSAIVIVWRKKESIVGLKCAYSHSTVKLIFLFRKTTRAFLIFFSFFFAPFVKRYKTHDDGNWVVVGYIRKIFDEQYIYIYIYRRFCVKARDACLRFFSVWKILVEGFLRGLFILVIEYSMVEFCEINATVMNLCTMIPKTKKDRISKEHFIELISTLEGTYLNLKLR